MNEKSVITIKIPSDLKKKMRQLKINWSEYIRNAIQKKLEEERKKIASVKLDEIRARSKPVATDELVAWIREYRER
jgi:post-segregation antitoxin (ccd killing protein)